MSDQLLRVTEIFYSLQGESSFVGFPTIFIRLTGCPLRCGYCDTAYAFQGGQKLTIETIMDQISQYQTPYVTVTGGEPLAQHACLELLRELCDKDYRVSLETSGALDISPVDSRVIRVMDIKTPGSAEQERNYFDNIDYLTPKDQVKFVICDDLDYEWSKEILAKYALSKKCEVLFSPCYGMMDDTRLADLILRDQLPVRFQIQLHKKLWGNVPAK